MVGSVRRLGARVRVAALAVAFGALVPSGCAPHTETRLGASEPRPTHGPGGVLVLEDAWARAATATWDADGAPSANGAVYLSIRNAGSQADRLTGAACGAAQTVEVHRSAMEDGVMRMRPAGEVEIPPHGRVALEPGGLHVMLIGLRHDLREGDVLPVTLRFAAAGDQTVRADVRPRSAASGTGTMASGSDPPVVMSTPAVRSRDVLFVIPRGTAAQQLRGEGGVAIPPRIELVAGGAVVLRNEDNAMHYFFWTPIAPGQTVRKEFPTAGEYGYTSILSCSAAGFESVSVHVRPR